MELSVKVHKIIIVLLQLEVLVSLLLVEEVVKDANLMHISFGVKHPQTFQES